MNLRVVGGRGGAGAQRVVILGRGASGKTTLARTLGTLTGLPVVELDKEYWPPDLTPRSHAEWAQRQRELIAEPAWIMDGDLGPYDVVDIRLAAADTVIFLDLPLALCVWRALRRSRERADFWNWMIRYRSFATLRTINRYAPGVNLYWLPSTRHVTRFLGRVARSGKFPD